MMAEFKRKQYWLIRYKLYHIPFWMLYNYIFWALKIDSASNAVSTIFFSYFFIKFLFYVIFPAIAVYFNLYFLVPRFLETGKYTRYIVFLLTTVAVCAACIVPAYYITSYLSGGTVETIYGIQGSHKFYQIFKEDPLRSTLACTTLAMSIKLTKNWVQSQRRRQILEKEKLETELQFLKYQFNPHFLFNSINSIFFLIHKNPDMASESLAKFSELLRYQLFECNDQQISLAREICCLENFIELEKLRQNETRVEVDIDEQNACRWQIAPFILMTFVENAFKHVSKHAGQPNRIDIQLTVDEGRLNFSISNTTSTDVPTELVKYGGIGLKNVQRRLDLVYPGRYTLEIENDKEVFSVELKLTLGALMLSQVKEIA